MWKQLILSEQTYFIYCNFNENTQDITFTLYDFKITWCQTINFKDVKLKVKLLNKRFDFNEDNIKEALKNDTIQSAALEESTNLESCLLKIKYRVKNCLLSYEWCLRRQNLLEFQQTIVQPLLLTLLDCKQQIEILTDSIRKKDIELKQFRIEGAVLNRKTLTTKPFDFDEFNKKFKNCKNTTDHFIDLATYVKEANQAVPDFINQNLKASAEKNAKPEQNASEEQRPNIKMSPRQKKRKANEVKMEHLQQHLKLRRLGLEYENSQSQSLSSGSSQGLEDSVAKGFKTTTGKEDEKSKEENQLSPRKSTRYATLKQTQLEIPHYNKTDLNDEDNLRASSQRIVNKCLDNRETIFSVDTNDEKSINQTNTNNFSSPGPKQTKLISASSSNNNSSNVFDFSCESEDDTPFPERKNLQKSKKTGKYRKQQINNTSLSLNKSSVLGFDNANSLKPYSPNNSLSNSSTPVIINEISSQLDNIRKELETLEAMRLADLQQRTCKV